MQHYNTFCVCRIPAEKVECSPLKLLQPPRCNGPAITIKAPVNHKLNQSTNEVDLSSDGKEHSPRQIKDVVRGEDCTVLNVTGRNDRMEDGKITKGHSSKFSCQWNEATTEDGMIHMEPEDEQSDEGERMEGGGDDSKDEENTEQKLYKIASELLQTERAYVARLHLLDQVSAVIHLWLPPFLKKTQTNKKTQCTCRMQNTRHTTLSFRGHKKRAEQCSGFLGIVARHKTNKQKQQAKNQPTLICLIVCCVFVQIMVIKVI